MADSSQSCHDICDQPPATAHSRGRPASAPTAPPGVPVGTAAIAARAFAAPAAYTAARPRRAVSSAGAGEVIVHRCSSRGRRRPGAARRRPASRGRFRPLRPPRCPWPGVAAARTCLSGVAASSGTMSGLGNARRLSCRIAAARRSTASVMAGSTRGGWAACRCRGHGGIRRTDSPHPPLGVSGPTGPTRCADRRLLHPYGSRPPYSVYGPTTPRCSPVVIRRSPPSHGRGRARAPGSRRWRSSEDTERAGQFCTAGGSSSELRRGPYGAIRFARTRRTSSRVPRTPFPQPDAVRPRLTRPGEGQPYRGEKPHRQLCPHHAQLPIYDAVRTESKSADGRTRKACRASF